MNFEKLRQEKGGKDDLLTGEERFSLRRSVAGILLAAAAAVVLFLVFSVFFRVAVISGASMEPTLLNRDLTVVQVFDYKPAQGDIVVIRTGDGQDRAIVKRVIALGGQSVDIDFVTGGVYVDGHKLWEPYLSEPTKLAYDVTFPVTVPEGYVFIMGDNRNHSVDSRSSQTGMIPVENIQGKVVWRLFPLSRMGTVG